MKKQIKYMLAILLVSAATVGAIAVAEEIRDGNYKGPWVPIKDNMVIDTTLPKVPAQVTLLKVDNKNIDQKRSGDITKNILGRKLTDVKSDTTRSVLKDGEETEFTVYKKGQLRYSTGKELSGLYKKEELLSEKQAKDVAKGLIQKYIDADILNKDMVDLSKLEVVNDETCRYNLQDSKTECYASNQHVNAYLSYNGIKLDGGGAKVRTYLAKNGEIVGLMNSVGKLIPDKKVSVITPQDAIEKIKKDGYRDVTINKMELVYEVKSPEDNADYIEPSYKIDGVMHTEGADLSFGVFVPATKK